MEFQVGERARGSNTPRKGEKITKGAMKQGAMKPLTGLLANDRFLLRITE